MARLLGDFAELTVGHVGPMASEYVRDGIPFLRSLNIRPFRIELADVKYITPEFHSRLRKSALAPGDVVVVRTGAPGTAAVIPDSLPCSNCSDLVVIRPGKDLDSRYLAALINGISRGFVFSRTVGAVQQHFNVGSAREIPIPDSSLEEQQRIAGVLGAFDDLIDTNERLVSSLREQVTSLFQRMMRTEPLESRPFFSVYEVDFGAPFSGDHFTTSGNGMPLLRIRDLKKMTSDVWTAERLQGDVVIVPGDVVVGMDAEFRATLWLGDPSLLNQRVCRVRSHVGGSAWVRESLVGPLAFIEGHKTGTTVAHLNKRDLTETRIPVPPEEAVRRFSAVADPMFAAIVELAQESRGISRVRNALLPLLMSGRVTVDEAWEAVS